MNKYSFIRQGLSFIARNKEIIYSLALIVIVPVFLFIQTSYIIKSFQENIDYELRNKALLAGMTLDSFAFKFLSDPQLLQDRLQYLKRNYPSISDGMISVPLEKGEGFKVVASMNKGELGSISNQTQDFISWHDNQAYARLASFKGTRYWLVTMPLHNQEGRKIALASFALSLARSDALVNHTIFISYLALVALVIVIIFLVANNTRLFGYVSLARKLKEVDQMKDEFISIASHELRTPISGIKSFLSMLKEGSLGKVPKEAKSFLISALAAANQLEQLIEDILNVSRIEQGRLKVSFEKLDANETLKEVTNQLALKAENKGLQLKVNLAAGRLPKISADKDRLRQVLINLIGNAIKYTKKGYVEVSSVFNEAKNTVEIVIRDTGVGISAQDREHLFEKFYRVQTDKTRAIRGTGLGLWISKQIIEIMKGKIFLESMEGVGTKITLVFPAVSGKK